MAHTRAPRRGQPRVLPGGIQSRRAPSALPGGGACRPYSLPAPHPRLSVWAALLQVASQPVAGHVPGAQHGGRQLQLHRARRFLPTAGEPPPSPTAC
eukprot:scaffold22647_cov73-Isochrysis_galbana.AAC.1